MFKCDAKEGLRRVSGLGQIRHILKKFVRVQFVLRGKRVTLYSNVWSRVNLMPIICISRDIKSHVTACVFYLEECDCVLCLYECNCEPCLEELALAKTSTTKYCVLDTPACEYTPASMSPSLSSMGTAEGSKASTTSATESTCAAGPLHGTARPVCVCVCVCVNHMHTHIHTPKLHKHNS